MGNLIQVDSSNFLNINYSWGSVSYDIGVLQAQSLAYTSSGPYPLFSKYCKNPVLRDFYSVIKGGLGHRISIKVSQLLQPIIKLSPHMIYCIKTERDRLPKSTVFLLRNSLVLPTLVWSWYGYHHWITSEELVQQFGSLSTCVGSVI